MGQHGIFRHDICFYCSTEGKLQLKKQFLNGAVGITGDFFQKPVDVMFLDLPDGDLSDCIIFNDLQSFDFPVIALLLNIIELQVLIETLSEYLRNGGIISVQISGVLFGIINCRLKAFLLSIPGK